MDPLSVAQVAVPAITASAALLGAVVTLLNSRGSRSRLRHDVEVLDKLPEGSARTKLLALVEAQVDSLVSFETESTRQTGLAVVAACFAVGLTAVSLHILTLGGWWMLVLVLTIPFAAVCAYGVFEAGQKVPRDEKGNRK